MLVDRFVADLEFTASEQCSRDLLRAVVLFEKLLDTLPLRSCVSRPLAASAAAAACHHVGMGGSIVAVRGIGVAGDLP